MTVVGRGTLGRAIAFANAAKGAQVRIDNPGKDTRWSAAAFIDERRLDIWRAGHAEPNPTRRFGEHGWSWRRRRSVET
jgi:3-hydroxyacyl-CoA dehydrogenase